MTILLYPPNGSSIQYDYVTNVEHRFSNIRGSISIEFDIAFASRPQHAKHVKTTLPFLIVYDKSEVKGTTNEEL